MRVVTAGGEHDDRHRRHLRRGPDAPADLEAVRPRQHDVEQHHVEAAVPERGEAALPVGGDGHVDLVLAEVLGDQGPETGVVVDEERGRARGHVATVTGSG